MSDEGIKIIAGPCSVDKSNEHQLLEIADISIMNSQQKAQKAIWGLRVVGLKSRTSMDITGNGMGIDFKAYLQNTKIITSGKTTDDLSILPSINIACNIIKKTGLVVATEIMDPLVQLPVYEKVVPKGKLFIWNPAVNQLGYQMHLMGIYAERNGWFIGIKNGKWFGESVDSGVNIMEKNWIGQISFATQNNIFPIHNKVAMIQRGVDVKDKGMFRYLPIHESAKKIKNMNKVKIFFDPSHSLGPQLRDRIVEETIAAMKLKSDDEHYLYDGILIEVGNSTTDTDQHITVEELKILCSELSKFRKFIN